MATNPAGGESAFAYFLTTGIPELVDHLIRLQGRAQRHGLRTLEDGVAAILTGLLRDLNSAAQEFSNVADALIIERILATRATNRPHQGEMETHIHSRPGPLGSVRVALIEELDKIINPNGYGPFWRAQEFGTGEEGVPSQAGRVLWGTFEPGGTRPDAAQRGLGRGEDLAFIPGGRNPGQGVISEELPGRHFLRDGSTEAGAKYLERMHGIEQRYIDELTKLTTTIRSQRRPAVYEGRVEG